MTMLAINWGFALLVTGIGIGTVFLLLVVLIWIINLQSKAVNSVDHSEQPAAAKAAATPAAVGNTDMHPTPYEQAAIAMAMHLYFDAHDEEPHVITIQEVERRYSPWSSKIYSMRNMMK